MARKEPNGKETILEKGLLKCKENDLITICLDCLKWEVEFWLNDLFIGSIKVKENITYYPIFNRAVDGIRAAFVISLSGEPKEKV